MTDVRPDVEILEQFVELGEEMLRSRSGGELTHFQVVTLGFLVRSMRDARAVILLCRQDFTEQALVLARSIWEAAVTVEYIRREDPEERALLYIEYDPVLRWRMLQKAVRNPDLRGSVSFLEAQQTRKQEFADLERRYHAVQARYPKPRYWSGKSLRAMAENLEILSDYLFAYSWMSEQAHVEVTAIGRQFALQGSNTLRENIPDYRAPAVVMAGWISVVLEGFNEAFGLSCAPRIEAVARRLGEEEGVG